MVDQTKRIALVLFELPPACLCVLTLPLGFGLICVGLIDLGRPMRGGLGFWAVAWLLHLQVTLGSLFCRAPGARPNLYAHCRLSYIRSAFFCDPQALLSRQAH